MQSVGGHESSPTAVPSRLARRASPNVNTDMADVMALVECIIGGVRRFPGERFAMPANRVFDLTGVGYIMPDALIDRMPPEAAAMWRILAPTKMALTDASLVCDDDTAAALWDAAGRILSPDGITSEYQPADPTPNAIRVLQLTHYDPGSSVYRYHSAANTVPGIVSAFVRYGYGNPHCHLRQWDGELHRRTVELLAWTADVIHVHMDYRTLHHDLRYVLTANQRAAITYHGSILPGDTNRVLVDNDADARMNAIRFGARPYHARYGVDKYLPIPVPVDDYTTLGCQRDPWRGAESNRKFRIAHSPTRREIKGTNDFLAAVDYLATHEGVPVEAVLIENMEHGEALRLKAGCDATFDSFWLGMQGSGIEAAAMGQVVIAGDPQAAAEAADLNKGRVPWTFANDKTALIDTIRALVKEPAYYAYEAARVGAYVRAWHDYPVVGALYRDYLHEELDRGTANR